MPTKDREVLIYLDGHARIVYLRSSARPIEYAVMLQRRDPSGWKTVIVADNSHRGRTGTVTDEHHCHRYIDDEKQPAEPLPFYVVNTRDAMAKAIQWFTDEWEGLIS